MAAGRVDVSRRDVLNFSGRSRSNGSCRAESIRGCSDDYPFSCNVRVLDPKGRRAFDNGSKGLESVENQGRALCPPQKKRKFSPIRWDLEDLKVSSANKTPAAGGVLQPKSNAAVTVLANVGVSKLPVTLNQNQVLEASLDRSAGVSKSLAISCGPLVTISSVPIEHMGDDEPEEGEVDDEEFFQARNVSMSRWASESPEVQDKGSEMETGCFLGSGSEVVDCQYDSCQEVDEEMDPDSNMMELESDDDGSSQHVKEPMLSGGRSINMLQGCRSVSEFEKLNRISEGTYGIVYRARETKTGEIVALKMVKMGMERDGFPLSALREINILLSFNHPSIVGVKEVVMDDHDNVFVVMEYMEHDLKWLMDAMKQPFTVSEVKCLMLQLLEGVKFLHDNWVLHRDLKTSNLLLNNSGDLKICDFGMSRQYGSPLKPYTPLVVTLWYRAPEVLLGTKQYSTAVDMWSVGCIMAEMLAKEPLFKGQREIDQLDKIFKVLGTPNDTIWPGFSKLPVVKPSFSKQPFNLLRKKFPGVSFTGSQVLSDLGFDLLSRLLTYDPEKRITAEEALNHGWFREVPLPKSKDFMPTFPARHVK